MTIKSTLKNWGIGRNETIMIGLGALALLFFKPQSTQSVFGDLAVDAGSSVGSVLWSVLTEFVKTNALWFTIIGVVVIAGYVLLPKKSI